MIPYCFAVQFKLEFVTECDKYPPPFVLNMFCTEHATTNSPLHEQLGIWPSVVITFHQIPSSGAGVAFMRISDGRADRSNA